MGPTARSERKKEHTRGDGDNYGRIARILLRSFFQKVPWDGEICATFNRGLLWAVRVVDGMLKNLKIIFSNAQLYLWVPLFYFIFSWVLISSLLKIKRINFHRSYLHVLRIHVVQMIEDERFWWIISKKIECQQQFCRLKSEIDWKLFDNQ